MANNFLIVPADLFRIRPIFATYYEAERNWGVIEGSLDGGGEFNCEFKHTTFDRLATWWTSSDDRMGKKLFYSYTTTTRGTRKMNRSARASSTRLLIVSVIQISSIFHTLHHVASLLSHSQPAASRHGAVSLFCVENFIERFKGGAQSRDKL